MADHIPSPSASVDADEIARFSALARDWWDPGGPFRVLHRFNPVRLDYIRDHVLRDFARPREAARPFEGLHFLDVGCGGGLLCEPMARLGATVTGIDPSAEIVATARHHAESLGLAIDYRAVTAESLAEAGERYDVVLAMEVLEHVNDMPAFLRCCARLVKPDGLMFLATINRTGRAFALAIVGAEYVLGWLPRGTHQWSKFITPDELKEALADAGLSPLHMSGVGYNPLADSWALSRDMSVNYMLVAAPAGAGA